YKLMIRNCFLEKNIIVNTFNKKPETYNQPNNKYTNLSEADSWVEPTPPYPTHFKIYIYIL
ncbi:MAG: hypothetical protein Q8830_03530, partial [Candidatus Phytoplasma australasiaticum]|nr:hypothetical protein [Candidatus Phytoplasma australasiaticum]